MADVAATKEDSTALAADATTATTNDEVALPPVDITRMNMADITGLHPMGIARTIINQFSRVDGKREPPSPSKTTHLRLVTINVSPFCEKVRWMLDLLEQEEDNPYFYTEDCHPAGFHAFQTVPLTNDTHSATPVLVFPDGSVRIHSFEILLELRPSLYPKEFVEEIKQFEVTMGERLAATVRCLVYYYLLDDEKKGYKTYAEVCSRNTSQVETILFEKMLDKGVDKALQKALVWNDEVAQKSTQEIHEVLEEVSQRLDRNGGDYLFGNTFTAADLAFATAAYHIMCPEEMSDFTISKQDSPPGWLDLIAQFQQTKAGQHCIQMYKKHRPVGEDGKVHVKTVNRDRNPFKESWFYITGAIGAAAGAVAAALWIRRRQLPVAHFCVSVTY